MAEEKKEEQKPKEEETKQEVKEEEKTEKPETESKEEKAEPKEKEEEKIEVPKKFEKMIKDIENLSVLELAELVKVLEKKFGVSSAVPVAAVAANGGNGAGQNGADEGKSEFNIELKEVGAKKIEVIKAVRDITGKGLKESKDLVDAAGSEAQIIKESVKKEEAEEIKKKFEEAGAKVELK